MEFLKVDKTHPITGFKHYNAVENKKYIKKDYVSTKYFFEEIEKGVEKKSGKYRAVYCYGIVVEKKIIIGEYDNIDDARKKYFEYINITPKNKGVYFSKQRYKYFIKEKGKVIWSKVRESEEDFLKELEEFED